MFFLMLTALANAASLFGSDSRAGKLHSWPEFSLLDVGEFEKRCFTQLRKCSRFHFPHAVDLQHYVYSNIWQEGKRDHIFYSLAVTHRPLDAFPPPTIRQGRKSVRARSSSARASDAGLPIPLGSEMDVALKFYNTWMQGLDRPA